MRHPYPRGPIGHRSIHTLGVLVALGVLSLSVAHAVPPPGDYPPPPPSLLLHTSGLSLGPLWPGVEIVSDPVLGTLYAPSGRAFVCLALPAGRERFALLWRGFPPGREADLPLQWELRWRGPGGWSDWQPPELLPLPGSGGLTLAWLIGSGLPAAYEFQARCRTQLDHLQLAGEYSGELRFSALPLPGQAPAPGSGPGPGDPAELHRPGGESPRLGPPPPDANLSPEVAQSEVRRPEAE